MKAQIPLTITLNVSDDTSVSNILWVQEMNVQNVLEAAYNISVNPPAIPPISFQVDYFGADLGYFVTQLNGISQMGTNYWFFYVNGVIPAQGLDTTIVKSGDVVLFKYEPYSPDIHGNTIYEKYVSRISDNVILIKTYSKY